MNSKNTNTNGGDPTPYAVLYTRLIIKFKGLCDERPGEQSKCGKYAYRWTPKDASAYIRKHLGDSKSTQERELKKCMGKDVTITSLLHKYRYH